MDIDPVAAAIIAAMGWTAVSFLKHLSAKDYDGAKTLAVVVVVCVGAAFLVQAAEVAFDGYNAAKVVLAGYVASSVLRVAYEFKKAFDNNDSANEPRLFGNPPA